MSYDLVLSSNFQRRRKQTSESALQRLGFFGGIRLSAPDFGTRQTWRLCFCDSSSICKKPCYTVLFLRSALPCDVVCHGNQTWLYLAKKIRGAKSPPYRGTMLTYCCVRISLGWRNRIIAEKNDRYISIDIEEALEMKKHIDESMIETSKMLSL